MWSPTELSSLFDVGSAKRVLKAQWQTKGIPFYRGREVTKLSQQGYVNNDLFISEELYSEYKDKYGVPSIGDIVITAIGTIGNSYIVQDNDKFYYKDASVLCLKKKSDVDSRFINYWLKSSLMKSQLDEGNGATVDTLTITKMKGLKISLPPLAEQKQIVAILDEAFAGIDKAIENTEKNIKNTKELFESYINNIFTQKGEEWREVSLLSLCERITQGPNPKYKGDLDNSCRVLKTKHLYDDVIHYEDSGLLSSEAFQDCSKAELQNGDLLLAIVGQGSINKCNVFENPTSYRFIFTRALGLIRTKKTELNPYFLKLYLQSRIGKGAVDSGIGGTSGQQVVTTTHLKSMLIPIPTMNTQNQIVEHANILGKETTKLETVYQQKLASLKELKQSLLQKAFSGELTSDMSEVA